MARGDRDAGALDALAALLDDHDVGGGKPPRQIGREAAGARADVEDPFGLPSVVRLQLATTSRHR
jgi:hypothetical protein